MTNELESLSNNQENKDAANKARAAANTIKGQQLQNRIEQGRNKPSIPTMAKIDRALKEAGEREE